MDARDPSDSSLLRALPYPILVVRDGVITDANESALRNIGPHARAGALITTVWPLFVNRGETTVERVRIHGNSDLVATVVSTTGLPSGEVVVAFRRGEETQLFLQPSRGYGSPRWFEEKLDLLVGIVSELSTAATLDEVYRRTIVLARERLDIDRIAILLIDRAAGVYRGTWGTSDHGVVVDESSFEAALDREHWAADGSGSQAHADFREECPLYSWAQPVGTGWNAKVNLWRGDEIIGRIVADNLLERRPLPPFMKELLRQLGSSVSQVIEFKRAEIDRRRQSDELERLVREKTAEVDAQYRQLFLINRRLTEHETLVTLGEGVAGLAHELINPIGIGVTASSGITTRTAEIEQALDSETVDREALASYVSFVKEAARILESSLGEARRLVHAFRRSAVDQVSDRLVDVNLADLVDTVLLANTFRWKRRRVDVIAEILPDLTMRSYPGILTQVLTNLLTNSLVHAFEPEAGGTIRIAARRTEGGTSIDFRDDGKGIAEENIERIFDAFFTTNREAGGSGLGLYLARDLVTGRLGGTITVESAPGAGTTFTIFLPERDASVNEG